MQEKTLEELLEDYAGIAVRYWRATGTSDEHKKDTEDMQEIARLISSREEKAREEGRKEARIVKLLEKLLDNRDHVRISKIGKIYREDIPPKYKYEVIAPKFKGSCYPEFTQEDDLEEALKSLIG